MTSTTQSLDVNKKHDLAMSVGRNTVFGMFSSSVQIATRFVTVPIVISYLGLGGYGIWSIIMATAAYMRFGSAGVKSAFQKYVAEATGNGDYHTAEVLLSTGCAAMVVLSAVCLTPVVIFSHDLARFARVPEPFLNSAARAISVLALFMIFANGGAVYEAIVMGGHRIDLVRKVNTILTVAEAVSFIVFLRMGYGLFAMAATMGISEVLYIAWCFVLSRRVLPQIRLRPECVRMEVLRELIRFAGSYQLVGVLEVLYMAILPVAILRTFGENPAGVYAVGTRLVAAAMVLHESFLQPILSGAAMVYASGSLEQMRSLLTKSFRVTLGLSLPPLALVGMFGVTMVAAWTGESNSLFAPCVRLVALAMLFRCVSRLQLIMYRVSGRALLDNIRQAVGIICLLLVASFSRQMGFRGVLTGLALSELIGMLFMFVAIEQVFPNFKVRMLLPDTLRILTATLVIVAVGFIAAQVPLHNWVPNNERLAAATRLAVIAISCFLVTWPTLMATKSISLQDTRTLFRVFVPNRQGIS
jgi:O-antigen/teichoic acid export membrane protein